MTKQELINLIATDILPKADAGKNAYNNLTELARRVLYGVTNPAVGSTLTQANIDAIVALYTPQYSAALTAIEAAGDALGTDIFAAQAGGQPEPGEGA